jgi:hypothetical protein
MPDLGSNAILGGPENLFLLRRGVTDAGVVVTPFDVADRVRMVQTYDSGAMRVVVDRNWRNPMYPSELAEFVHLHPLLELRAAVLAGLRRCFLEELVAGVVVTSGYADMDLTFQYHWITDPSQVLRVQYGSMRPYGDAPFSATMQQGHVMLRGAWGSYAAASVWVTALRPASSWVNDADSDVADPRTRPEPQGGLR